MDTKRYTDPKIFGPGIWFVLHTEAVRCTDDKKKEEFIKLVNSLHENFRCEKCKLHFGKFIDRHPLKSYWSIYKNKVDVGFFKWTWELHNEVNVYLKKSTVSFDEAYDYYDGKNIIPCFDCGDDNTDKSGIRSSSIKSEERSIPPVIYDYISGMNRSSLVLKPFGVKK